MGGLGGVAVATQALGQLPGIRLRAQARGSMRLDKRAASLSHEYVPGAFAFLGRSSRLVDRLLGGDPPLQGHPLGFENTLFDLTEEVWQALFERPRLSVCPAELPAREDPVGVGVKLKLEPPGRGRVVRPAGHLCEGCGAPAPFMRRDGRPYLEPHHTRRLTDGARTISIMSSRFVRPAIGVSITAMMARSTTGVSVGSCSSSSPPDHVRVHQGWSLTSWWPHGLDKELWPARIDAGLSAAPVKPCQRRSQLRARSSGHASWAHR